MYRNGCNFCVRRNTLHHLALCRFCALWKSAIHYRRRDVLARGVGAAWWEMCRLPLARELTAPLQVLYWGGEVMLIWGWYNSPEVTGDLMRGTWHRNAFYVSSLLPMQMMARWWSGGSERAGSRQAAVFLADGDQCRRQNQSGEEKIYIYIHVFLLLHLKWKYTSGCFFFFFIVYIRLKQFPTGSQTFKSSVGAWAEWLINTL